MNKYNWKYKDGKYVAAWYDTSTWIKGGKSLLCPKCKEILELSMKHWSMTKGLGPTFSQTHTCGADLFVRSVEAEDL
jgi:hypothetical protein